MTRKHALAALAAARSLRETVEHLGEDMQPILSVDGTEHPLVVVSFDDVEHLGDVALIAARAESCVALVFVSDAYVHLDASPEEAASHREGEFQEAWERGEREDLSESIVVVAAYRDGAVEMLGWPYERTEKGFAWGDPVESQFSDGPIQQTLRRAFLEAVPVALSPDGLAAAFAMAGFAASPWIDASRN